MTSRKCGLKRLLFVVHVIILIHFGNGHPENGTSVNEKEAMEDDFEHLSGTTDKVFEQYLDLVMWKYENLQSTCGPATVLKLIHNMTTTVEGLSNYSLRTQEEMSSQRNLAHQIMEILSIPQPTPAPKEDCVTKMNSTMTSVSKTVQNGSSQLEIDIGEIKALVNSSTAARSTEHKQVATNITDDQKAVEQRVQEHLARFKRQTLQQLKAGVNMLLIKTHATTFETKRNCDDIYKNGNSYSGVYAIQSVSSDPIIVWCEDGWLVVARRENGDISFDKSNYEYQSGFGKAIGDHWVGLHDQHIITSQKGKFQSKFEFYIDGTNSTEFTASNTEYTVFPKVNRTEMKWLLYEDFDVLNGSTIEIGSSSSSDASITHVLGNLTTGLNNSIFKVQDNQQSLHVMAGCSGMQGTGWWSAEGCAFLVLQNNVDLQANGTSACTVNNPVCARLGPYLLRRIQIKIKPEYVAPPRRWGR